MGANITGGGFLSGLGSFSTAVVNTLNLLASKILGSTYVPGSGGSSYYTTMVTRVITTGENKNLYMTLNDSKFSTSTNGIDFETSDLPSSMLYNAYYGGGRFFVSNGNYQGAYSTSDGVTWSLLPVFGGYAKFSYDGAQYSYVTNSRNTGYSTDGVTWTFGGQLPNNTTVESYGAQVRSYVTRSNGKKLVFSDSYTNPVIKENDSSSWVHSGPEEFQAFKRIIPYGNGFYAIGKAGTGYTGYSPYVVKTTDSIIWNPYALNSTTQSGPTGIAVNGNTVVITMQEPFVQLSVDGGQTYNAVSAPEYLNDVAYGNGVFVAVSYNTYGKVWTSSDGTAWTERTAPLGSYLFDVTFLNGYFISTDQQRYASNGDDAGSGNNWIMYSTDGINWSKSAVAGGGGAYITYGNGYYVTTNNSGVSYSTDLLTWTQAALSAPFQGIYSGFEGVGFDGTRFIVTNRNIGSIWHATSPDSGWTHRTGIMGEFVYKGVVANQTTGKFYVYSRDQNTSNNRLYTGTMDGVWNSFPLSSGLGALGFIGAHDGNKYCAINTEGLSFAATSYNGTSWVKAELPQPDFYGAPAPWVRYAYGKDSNNNNYHMLTAAYPYDYVCYSQDFINWSLVDFSSDSDRMIYDVKYIDGAMRVFSRNLSNSKYTISTYSTTYNSFSHQDINISGGQDMYSLLYGNINNQVTRTETVEVQVSIGNQGEDGAEVIAPVDVYTVPAGKVTTIDEVTVKNASAYQITYDLGVLAEDVELSDENALVNDQPVLAGATDTVVSISGPQIAGKRVVVLPSAVDVVEVKVYGTETNA